MADNSKNDNPLAWLGILSAPNWRVGRPLGHLVGAFLSAAVPLLFLFAMIAAFAVMWQTIRLGTANSAEGVNLGTGALIAALLGAPFLIWSTVLKYQTVRYQKEGHITDRINKSVEQLGADKTVERIGRPVTVWTGKPTKVNHYEDKALEFHDQPRTTITPKKFERTYIAELDEVQESYRQLVTTWPEERTVIQWQVNNFYLEKTEIIGMEGAWQVFKETVPNIEVRIGAILSLERIAQDSTLYDNGRDHVRIMEILCAYIKENAPIRQPSDRPPRDETSKNKESSVLYSWATGSPKPRADIAMALRVIGRRSVEQVQIETSYPSTGESYRLDLSGIDIRRSNLADLNFSKANFSGSWLDGSILNDSNFQETNLLDSGFVGVSAGRGLFQGANLGADFSWAVLDEATFEFFEADDIISSFKGLNGRYAHFYQAQLIDAKISFKGNPPTKRNYTIGAVFTDAIMRGCLFDGYSQFFDQFWPEKFHNGNKLEKGISFRNSVISDGIDKRCTLDCCFGDGSVVLADGSGPKSSIWPKHWPKEKLSDSEFAERIRKWRGARQ